MKPPVRVALVASTFGVGGAERVTANVILRLPRERIDVHLHFLHDAGVVGRELFAQGIAGLEHVARGRRDARCLARLVCAFRHFRPHVVFCLDHRDAMAWGRLAAVITRVRAIAVASHATGLMGRRDMFGASERLLMEFTDRVVAVSRTHAGYLRDRESVSGSRIVTIPNGIDLPAWPMRTAATREAARAVLGIGAQTPVVLMVAALRPEKAHEALLTAVEILRRDHPGLRALVAGDGGRRAELEALATARGIGDAVAFLGTRADVARLLHASDVVVLPSRDSVETLPLAVLEAMACGAPVVASRVGSVAEVVEHGVTGRLIPPADAVALAREIGHILGDPDHAAALARAARERVVTEYGIERTTAGYRALFEELAIS